jgi:MFS transporter, CP family, cyanate transporter
VARLPTTPASNMTASNMTASNMTASNQAPSNLSEPAVPPWALVLGVLALALNLRAALSGYPPLLPSVRADLQLSAGMAGLAQGGAALAMAAGSFVGVPLAVRFGAARSLGPAVGLVAAGSLVRGVPAAAALFGGTLLVGLGIGTAGVFLAGMVRTHFAARAGTITGHYVVAMLVGSTVASASAVPLASWLGGWSLSLATWAMPALLAVVLWSRLTRRLDSMSPDGVVAFRERPRTPRRRWTRLARLMAAYQAGTALVFYGWLTWLAPYYQSQGMAPTTAGILMAVFSAAQVPSALLAPVLAQGFRLTRRPGSMRAVPLVAVRPARVARCGRRWRFWAALAVGGFALGTVGALLVPLPPVVGPWPWVVLIGLGGGAMFPLGMTIIAWRTPDGPSSASVSGLALGVGYIVAGIGPLLMGLLVDTAGYRAAIGVLLAAAAMQAWTIARIGGERRVL